MVKLSKPARRKRMRMRKITGSKAARSIYKIGRKTARSGARSVRKRAGTIVGHAFAGNASGLRDEAIGVGRDMRRTAGKATQKAVR